MTNKYHYQNMTGIKKTIFKIADAFKSRGMKPKPKFNKGGRVGFSSGYSTFGKRSGPRKSGGTGGRNK